MNNSAFDMLQYTLENKAKATYHSVEEMNQDAFVECVAPVLKQGFEDRMLLEKCRQAIGFAIDYYNIQDLSIKELYVEVTKALNTTHLESK